MPFPRAHAKAIIVGEHSVLYGSPAIAVPLRSLEIEVDCSPTLFESSINTDGFCGRLRDLPKNFSGISLLAARMLGSHCVNLHFKSSIPQGAGLGSSAASSLAMARSLNFALSMRLKEDDILELCSQAEDAVHGKASGLDLCTCASKTPIFFSKGVPAPLPSLGAFLLVVYSGEGGKTKSAIKKASRAPKSEEIMERLCKICTETVENWGKAEKVGEAMTKAHALLRELGLSTPKLDEIVERCMDLGALGAKLTGSGLGGCAIGLFENEASAKKAQRSLSDFASWVEEV
ncbi:MAG: mevalonate kinase [Aeriscardovia sp.]|nr:mevalonate kinase [Aeriscardovia sp.]